MGHDARSRPRTARRSITRIGAGSAGGLQPRLAAQRRRLRGPDVLPGLARLSLHRPRPARPWPLEPAVARQRPGHLCRRSRRAGRRSSISKDAIHVGHSTGGGEVARYIGRHGTKRVAKAVLIGAVPPLMLKTAANPGGLPIEVFDQLRAGVLADRSQFWKDLSHAVLRLQPAGRQDLGGRARVVLAAGHDGGLPAVVFLHQGVLRDGPDRGPEEDSTCRP